LQENLCSPLQEPSFARTFFLLSFAREPLTSSAGARIAPKVFCCPPLQKNLCSPLQEPSFARTFFLLSFAREPLTSSARALIGPKVFCYPPLQENLCLLCRSPHFTESFFQTSQPHSDHRLLHLKPLQHIRRECLYRQQSASPATHFRNSAAPIFVPIIPTQGWLAPLPAQL
jgi:hypothetical protein